MADTKKSGQRGQHSAGRRPTFSEWSKLFLSELAATSNVRAAARTAGVHTATAYDARRADAEFNRKWQAALCEGYDHLEMELLHRLRMGEVKPAKDAKRGMRLWDNATAFRLLSAHRESAAQHRAALDNEDADAVLASIDAKLDSMRERAHKSATSEADDQE
ncbi:MAG: hypothetical protein KUG65_10820 [Sphingomonadaceae bacterium]|nr:hypothetical protein [Sphingomonadaceae bacterium]